MDSIPLYLSIIFLPFSLKATVALVFIILLLCMSAFVSASEVAFFSLSPQDYEELDNDDKPRSNNVKFLLQKPEYLLATILITNNFVNVAIIILSSLFISYTIDFTNNPLLGFIFQTIIITFMLLLLGEIMPKIYAQQHSLIMARRSGGTLKFLQKIFMPFNRILVSSTSIVNKQLQRKRHNNISMDEISQALEITSDTIPENTDILKGITTFGNLNAASVMTSRMDMITLDINSDFKSVINNIITHEYSRIPILQNTYDNIRGILYAKDLIPHINKPNNFKWQTLIRQPYFVPETKKIDDLLQEFQKNKIHIAIVVDEFGGTSGMVTMEDILEEVVGEISDEYDMDELLYKKIDDNKYLFEGKILLTDFFKIDNINADDFQNTLEEVDTLAGLILEIKQDFPSQNEIIKFKKYIFKITAIDERRILQIELSIDDTYENNENN